jgi:NNP family nitrate/nitrite transporter-like MFS transporter
VGRFNTRFFFDRTGERCYKNIILFLAFEWAASGKITPPTGLFEMTPSQNSPSGFSLPRLPLFLLVSIFYLNFVSRVIMAPLLPIVEAELGLGHGQAGSLFFFMASGYGVGLLGSGFISHLLTHRLTIAFAGMMGGLALMIISRSASIGAIHAGLVLIGIFAGFYLPSGIATLTELVSKEHWGKVMAIHELAPNTAFITAPLLAEFLLRFFSWRETLSILGAWAILMPILFLLFGRGSRKRGEPPRLRLFREVLSNPSCWVMALYFMVIIGSSMGIYAVMPLFLVSEMGMDRPWANTLIGFSRSLGIVVLFISGMMIDRIGPIRALTAFMITTGLFTVLLGIIPGTTPVSILIFLQAGFGICLFPTGFTILSLLFPERLRGAAVSLVIFMGFLFGAGVIPSAIGYWAEAFSFASAFAIMGAISLALVPFFRRATSGLKLTR